MTDAVKWADRGDGWWVATSPEGHGLVIEDTGSDNAERYEWATLDDQDSEVLFEGTTSTLTEAKLRAVRATGFSGDALGEE